MHDSDLVGTDDKHNAVHVGLRAHFLFHLPQPAVQSIETLPEADVVNQQHPLAVLVELITHLEGINNTKKNRLSFPGKTAPPVGASPTLQGIQICYSLSFTSETGLKKYESL